MTLPNALTDRDRYAFEENSGDQGVDRRVVIKNVDPIDVNIASGAVTINADSIQSGTVDGTAVGTERTFVNNRKQQVLSAHDLVASYTWLDFGTKNERVSVIVYTSATFAGVTITRTFSYTAVGSNYRLDTETWTSNVGG